MRSRLVLWCNAPVSVSRDLVVVDEGDDDLSARVRVRLVIGGVVVVVKCK